MFTSLWTGFSNACDAVKEYFGWASKRTDLNNTPEMRANAAADTRERIAAQAAKDVADQTLDQLRKDASEN